MKTRTSVHRLRRRSFSVLAAAAVLAAAFAPLLPPPLLAADDVQAVNTRVADDYVRVKLTDGSFQPETYAFGPGGYWSGDSGDKSIDKVKFLDVAHTLAEPLASQGYLPSRDPKTTKLLIMVYWGVTNSALSTRNSSAYQAAAGAFDALRYSIASHPKMDRNGQIAPLDASTAIQRSRGAVRGEAADESLVDSAIQSLQAFQKAQRLQAVVNSKLLGYDSWWADTAHFEGTPLDTRRLDLLYELEDSRYFVVLMAYDFQLMWKQKQNKLLWETRFSISQRHHEFDKALYAMAAYAARHFGRDTHGLQHSDAPIGRVEMGELKSINLDAEEKR